MMLMCCCAKARKDDDITIDGPESRIKNINRILLEFVSEESKIGLKEIPCLEMIEKVLLASNKGEVPKKEIISIYKSTEQINQNSIKNFMIQDFFFTDGTRQKYDFNKVVLFNLLYTGGKEVEKANFLFNIIENTSSTAVHNHSQKLLCTLENLTYIPCIVVGEIINSVRRFQSEQEDSEFQELLSLYSTNSNMLREFSNHLSSQYMFPSSEDRQYLLRQDFLKKMEDCAYLLIKPHEIRKKYTEYVWQNKARALLPSRVLRRTKDASEELKNGDVTSSEKQSLRGSFRSSKQQSNSKQQQRVKNENQMIEQLKRQSRIDKIEKLMPLQSPYQSNVNDLNRSGSDISMAVYRYEDKSARESNNNSPKSKPMTTKSKQPQNQNSASANNNSNNSNYNSQAAKAKVSPLQKQKSSSKLAQPSKSSQLQVQQQQQLEELVTLKGPSPRNRHNDSYTSDRDIHQQLLNMSLKRNSIVHRESSETQASLSNNLKKYPNVQAYLKEMFGEQFVNFVSDLSSPFDAPKQKDLQRKLQAVKSLPKLQFPDYNSYPYHVREIFEYFKAIIHKEDLIEFAKGKLYKENIINVYLKTLEKINLVRQSQYNFQRATTRNSIDLYNQGTLTPQKLLYFNTSFSRKLNNDGHLKDCLNMLQNFFKYDQVVLPFFIDEGSDQRCLVVSVKISNTQVDLYDRERETDNHDISDTVLHLMDLASRIQELDFNEDQIDGGVEGVFVNKEEDMIVAVCYIAECITFGRVVDLDNFNVDLERQRILDVFLTLLNFE